MNPACTGESDLFESVHAEDHELAAMICNSCPVIEQCRTIRDQPHVDGKVLSHHGTWAGELWLNGARIDPDTRAVIAKPVRRCATCNDLIDTATNGMIKFCKPCRAINDAKRKAEHDRRRWDRERYRDRRNRWYGVANDRTCPVCGALPGKPCAVPRKDRASLRITYMHAARRAEQVASEAC